MGWYIFRAQRGKIFFAAPFPFPFFLFGPRTLVRGTFFFFFFFFFYLVFTLVSFFLVFFYFFFIPLFCRHTEAHI